MPLSFAPLFIALAALSLVSFAQKPDKPFADGEVLIKVKNKRTSTSARDLYARAGVRLIEHLGDIGWQRVRLSSGKSVKTAIAELQGDSEIEAVQPNFYYRLLAIPNDPQWMSTGMYGLPKISAPQAWDLTTGSSSVVVANIDTGMLYTHEDLAPNMWTNPGEINGNGIDDDGNGLADDFYGYDFFFNDPDPLDENGHGTHTGGTIGAAGNNALGVVGVNWTVKIMAIKIYDSDGFGTTSAMLINAYNYIRMMKNRGINIRVTNNSYSGCDEACGFDQATKDALDALGDAGVLNVFAAGNNGWNNDTAVAPAFPAAYASPSVVSVASSTSTDARSSFSNWGPLTTDLAAPGSGILSTTRASNSSYGGLSGTSMASPHVAGAAALLSAFNPALSAASLKATLLNTVDSLSGWESTPIRTNGRLNVFNALQNQTVCTLELPEGPLLVHPKGGYITIDITVPANCDYSVKTDHSWVHIDGSREKSGSGQIRLWVKVSRSIFRSGTITVGGQAITLIQSRT